MKGGPRDMNRNRPGRMGRRRPRAGGGGGGGGGFRVPAGAPQLDPEADAALIAEAGANGSSLTDVNEYQKMTIQDLNRLARELGLKGTGRMRKPELMVLVGAIMTYALATRSTLDLNVIRDRSPPFVRLADGGMRNDYALKLINMAPRVRRVRITVSGLDGAHLISNGHQVDANGAIEVDTQSDGVANVRVHVAAPSNVGPGSHPMRFTITDTETGEQAESASAFFAGAAP